VKPTFGQPSVVKVIPNANAIQVETKPDKQFICDYVADENASQVCLLLSLSENNAPEAC
jgi:hypothetical protein